MNARNGPDERGKVEVAYVFADRFQAFCIHVLPYPLHVIPVCDDTVFERIVYLEKPPILLRHRPYEHIALQSTCHCPYVLRPAHV